MLWQDRRRGGDRRSIGPGFYPDRRRARISIHEHGTTIVLPCGFIVEGRPHDTDAYRATARDLGYGEGPEAALRCCQDHDALHIALIAFLGIPESFSLRQAAGLDVDAEIAGIEEAAVLAVQKLMIRGGGRMPSL